MKTWQCRLALSITALAWIALPAKADQAYYIVGNDKVYSCGSAYEAATAYGLDDEYYQARYTHYQANGPSIRELQEQRDTQMAQSYQLRADLRQTFAVILGAVGTRFQLVEVNLDEYGVPTDIRWDLPPATDCNRLRVPPMGGCWGEWYPSELA